MRSLCLAVTLSAALAAATPAEVTEPFSQTVPLTADGSFSIENVNGPVSIETWDRNEVEINATRSAPDAETLQRIKIQVEAESNEVSVSTEYEPETKGGSVAYRIRVPRAASLDVELVNGPIRILNPAGEVDAESVNGSIEIGDASGPVSAESVNGPVEVGYVSLAQGEHEFEAVNGRLTLRMPSAVSGVFHAESVNGDIETDFPLEVRKAKYGPQRSLSGTLGQGGPEVNLETVNGGIELRAGGESVATRIRYELDRVVQ